MDEQRWVRQAQEGDLEAFGHLVGLDQTPIYNLAYLMLGRKTMMKRTRPRRPSSAGIQYLHRYDPARPFRHPGRSLLPPTTA
ncbi:MAG: hypothetical protein RMK65_08530 [Anaerolineae bacterium]|nr:hypothetical protein [Anaerolineae bacterium]